MFVGVLLGDVEWNTKDQPRHASHTRGSAVDGIRRVLPLDAAATFHCAATPTGGGTAGAGRGSLSEQRGKGTPPDSSCSCWTAAAAAGWPSAPPHRLPSGSVAACARRHWAWSAPVGGDTPQKKCALVWARLVGRAVCRARMDQMTATPTHLPPPDAADWSPSPPPPPLPPPSPIPSRRRAVCVGRGTPRRATHRQYLDSPAAIAC